MNALWWGILGFCGLASLCAWLFVWAGRHDQAEETDSGAVEGDTRHFNVIYLNARSR